MRYLLTMTDELRILCCTANIGNTIFDDMSEWVPKDGIGPGGTRPSLSALSEGPHRCLIGEPYHVIAVGMQEAVFSVSADQQNNDEVCRSILLLNSYQAILCLNMCEELMRWLTSRPPAIGAGT